VGLSLMDETKVFEAYARLKSLKANIPQHRELEMKWVSEYHSILDVLENETGKDFGNFKVPESETPVRKTKGDYVTANSPYYYVQTCDRAFLMMKIDSFLMFFDLFTESKKSGKSPVGFTPPRVS
jgi:hypothetical protein